MAGRGWGWGLKLRPGCVYVYLRGNGGWAYGCAVDLPPVGPYLVAAPSVSHRTNVPASSFLAHATVS